MFSHKKGGVVEIGGDSKTVVISLTNTTKLFLKLPFSVCGVCVCVCFAHLHHFYQYSVCFKERT